MPFLQGVIVGQADWVGVAIRLRLPVAAMAVGVVWKPQLSHRGDGHGQGRQGKQQLSDSFHFLRFF